MSPSVGRNTFRIATTLAPFALMIILELQRQITEKQIDLWTLSSVGLGALTSLIVATFNLQRAATEVAEAKAEVVTGVDADADDLVETEEE